MTTPTVRMFLLTIHYPGFLHVTAFTVQIRGAFCIFPSLSLSTKSITNIRILDSLTLTLPTRTL